MTPTELVSTLNFRYATKQFDATKKIPADAWSALEQALLLAPSSFGFQPWKFIVVDTPEVRQQLREVSWGQGQVTDSSHYVVFAAKTDLTSADVDRLMHILATAQGRDEATLAGYRGMIDGSLAPRSTEVKAQWNARQLYIALGQFMLAAANLGIDTCPLEGLDPAKYDEILGLTGTGYTTFCACAVGYRAEGDKYASLPKARYPLAEVIEHR
jgi:nitroreductase